MLGELGLDSPLPVGVRSDRVEVAILAFMFFTLVLRGWRQPSTTAEGQGADTSAPKGLSAGQVATPSPGHHGVGSARGTSSLVTPSSRSSRGGRGVARASAVLRQPALLAYLLEILKGLEKSVKAPVGGADGAAAPADAAAIAASSRGALLTVRRDVVAGNFHPFFPDSYAKSHRADLFDNWQQLLLINAFRLASTIVRPDKASISDRDRLAASDRSQRSPLHKLLLEGGPRSLGAGPGKAWASSAAGAGSHGEALGGLLPSLSPEWQDVLCSYISNPAATCVRKYARRLLVQAGGGKAEYYAIRDSWQLEYEFRRLRKLSDKSGRFRDPLPYEKSVKLVRCLSTMVEVASTRSYSWQGFCMQQGGVLNFLLDSSYFVGEESVLQALKLLTLAFATESSSSSSSSSTTTTSTSHKPSTAVSASQTPSAPAGSREPSERRRRGDVAGGALGKERGGGGGRVSERETEGGALDMGAAVDELFGDTGALELQRFISVFLLEWNAASVRAEAASVLKGAWRRGRKPFREALLRAILGHVADLPPYGQNLGEYVDLATWLLARGSRKKDTASAQAGKRPEASEPGEGGGKAASATARTSGVSPSVRGLPGSAGAKAGSVDSGQEERNLVETCLREEGVLEGLMQALRSQNELLANHPNARIYNVLRNLVEFDGYYLESEPCLACSSPEVPYSRMKLDNIKAETKFTDTRILIKCSGAHTVQSVSMTVHDARRSKSVRRLNLYYNNRPVADLSELRNNWALWRRAKSCDLHPTQTELKVEFPIPITACNLMIELDAFYENLQASSQENLQCPRCSRYVTDKHGICGNCHENAYQCRQCRNINYENLDSFLCNECGFCKYGRFEFTFVAKPSFKCERMQTDNDMKRGLAVIEVDSESAHQRYQQLQGFKKPLLKLVTAISESDASELLVPQTSGGAQQQQAQANQAQGQVARDSTSLTTAASANFKVNRKVAILGLLYGEKCRSIFDSVSKSMQTLMGTRRALMEYLERRRAEMAGTQLPRPEPRPRPQNHCFGCANAFISHALNLIQMLARLGSCQEGLVSRGVLQELFENNIHQGPRQARVQARVALCLLTEAKPPATDQLNALIQEKVLYGLSHYRSVDVALCVRDELELLLETCSLRDVCWESRLRVVFHLLFQAIKVGAQHPSITEHVILSCFRIISRACAPAPKRLPPSRALSQTSTQGEVRPLSPQPSTGPSAGVAEPAAEGTTAGAGVASPDNKVAGSPLVTLNEWREGASYVDFERRERLATVMVSGSGHAAIEGAGGGSNPRKPKTGRMLMGQQLELKYWLRWRRQLKERKGEEPGTLENSSWVRELILSPCSPAIRWEVCNLIQVLFTNSKEREARFLNLLMTLLPKAQGVGESAAEYFALLSQMVVPEEARLFLTARGFLGSVCSLMEAEVARIQAQEKSDQTDISQGYTLHKLVQLLSSFLEVSTIRKRFISQGLMASTLDAFLGVRSLVVQKTKLTGDSEALLSKLLDSLLSESEENKRHFTGACVAMLRAHAQEPTRRPPLFILEQLCHLVVPEKPEPEYMLVLTKAHTQEEFIRGSMTKNPYSSREVGPLMRDVKNKICQQLELLGLLEDDFGMELLVAGNIIKLDLSVAQVYEKVWRRAQTAGAGGGGECPPMTVIYRLQGLDGEATETMVSELEDDRGEAQDPEVEFAIAGVVAECDGLGALLEMVRALPDEAMRGEHEETALLLRLLMYCCKIRANRQAALRLGGLPILLERAHRAFQSNAAATSSETLLLIVESLVTEANESEPAPTLGQPGGATSAAGLPAGSAGAGVDAVAAVRMFLDKLSAEPAATAAGLRRIRGGGAGGDRGRGQEADTVARILPYLTYGESAAMEVLVDHFAPSLQDWEQFDKEQERLCNAGSKAAAAGDAEAQHACHQRLMLENFVRLTEAIKRNASGDQLKSLIMGRGIVTRAVAHLKRLFPQPEPGTDVKSTPEWALALSRASVPIILSMLGGLARAHEPIQKCLEQESLLPTLHVMEGVPGENGIGARAENLLDVLGNKSGDGEGFLMATVSALRSATKEEMRRRALKRREELLKGLGMHTEQRSDGREKIIVPASAIDGLEDVEEEGDEGVSCMVCREGYRLRPLDVMGAYSFSKRVDAALGMPGCSRPEWAYTTVSHFNTIHFQCHQEAKKADSNLRAPKKEWEGATLRNSETLCNNIFPLMGPSVPLSAYTRCVDLYWEHLNAVGRVEGSRLRLILHDIASLIGRFAVGASFSSDSKGGGRESNAKLLPFMVQMAHYLGQQAGSSQLRAYSSALTAFLSAGGGGSSTDLGTTPPSSVGALMLGSTPPRGGTPPRGASLAGASALGTSPSTRTSMWPGISGGPDESVLFMLVVSILTMSLTEWTHNRKEFIRKAVAHAYMQRQVGQPLLPILQIPAAAADVAARQVGTDVGGAGPSSSGSEAFGGDHSRGGEGEQAGERKADMTDGELHLVVQPMLVYVGLVDQLQKFLKTQDRGGGGGKGEEKGESSSVGDDGEKPGWQQVMAEKLKDISGMLRLGKEVLEWLEEMQDVSSLQEAFDIMGALQDALSEGHVSCEDFVYTAIGAKRG